MVRKGSLEAEAAKLMLKEKDSGRMPQGTGAACASSFRGNRVGFAGPAPKEALGVGTLWWGLSGESHGQDCSLQKSLWLQCDLMGEAGSHWKEFRAGNNTGPPNPTQRLFFTSGAPKVRLGSALTLRF